MTKEEFTKAMAYLGFAYNKEFTSEQVGVWYTFFTDTNYNDFIRAIKRLISTSRFMPSIAEIREEIATITVPGLSLTADGEWEKVQRAVKRFGMYRAKEAVKELNPITLKVVERLGGFSALCRSEDGDWVRRNFMQLFEAYMQRERTTAAIPEPHLSLEEMAQKEELRGLARLLLGGD